MEKDITPKDSGSQKEEKIRKIADVLKNSGLALSESEALNRAKEIAKTEEKIKNSIKEKGIKPSNFVIPSFDEDKSDKPISELMKEAKEEEKTE